MLKVVNQKGHYLLLNVTIILSHPKHKVSPVEKSNYTQPVLILSPTWWFVNYKLKEGSMETLNPPKSGIDVIKKMSVHYILFHVAYNIEKQ